MEAAGRKVYHESWIVMGVDVSDKVRDVFLYERL